MRLPNLWESFFWSIFKKYTRRLESTLSTLSQCQTLTVSLVQYKDKKLPGHYQTF